ncbi:MAG TPA: CHAD domain-containing protein [Gemmatimonadaceae bacterium]|nr:CHAD domain-containing protein [Gemmatimonadaceae bacterium]
MGYRLKARGGMRKQLRRIVRSELTAALDALDGDAPDDNGIYEARKCVKKIRAVLRLLRQPLASGYTDENARLRTVAHDLSSLRDADATLDTVRELRGRYPNAVSPHVVRAVSHGLSARKQRAKAEMESIVRRARKALRASCDEVLPEIQRVGDFPAARAGAVDGYRRARAAGRDLTLDAEPAAFHEWRKRVKDHWYQVRLFARLPNGPRSRPDTLRRLETWLGKEHDLATLNSIVIEGDDRFGDARARTLLLGSIMKRQRSLRRRSLALGHRLFGQTPKDFRASITRWWRQR